jgi:hypothetical protein
MLFLPENRILRWLVVTSTIAVVICYSWLAAHLLEPQFTTPAYISDTYVRAVDSKISLFEDKFREYPQESARISSELGSLEPLLNWLGPLDRPVEILVDEKQPDQLLVTDSHIEIGHRVLLARGQLTKAMLKAWILQHASLAITSSHLRLEAASDVLMAMLSGGLSLEVPGFQEPITFDSTDRAWWTYADSYIGVCTSPWKSLELTSLCSIKSVKADAVNVSELSFRAFLGSRIWKSYQATPLRGRLAFARTWVNSLSLIREVKIPDLKSGWLSVVQGELDVLLPSKMDPLVSERAAWTALVDAPLIVIDGRGRVSAPGTLKIVSPVELPIARARMAVMTVCSAPSLRDVMALKVAVDRVVWRPDCAARKTDFVQVRPSAIRIALDRGLARPTDKLDKFVLSNRSASANSHWLGVADAKWDEGAHAYQVRGAIQAVEMFRLKN